MKKKCNQRSRKKLRVVGKFLLTMKLTILLSFLGVFQLSATVYSQNSVLSIDLTNSTIKEVLKIIEDQSEYRFFYNEKFVDLNRKVSLNMNGEKVEDILDEVFEGSRISYKIMKNNLIIITPGEGVTDSDATQIRSLSGKVTDNAGSSLPGVSVVIKATTTGTITDTDGSYTLPNVPDNSILIFSFVGMKTQEIPVSGKSVINVALEEETIGLEEVVAIGYGTTSQKTLTTAAAHFKSEKLESLPITNIADAFSGQLSGVLADNSSGAPGSSPVIRIRGYGSINAGSEPLYVIDGMMANSTQFASLNPKSVESIDILKDAAAGAIYGSRAGNGVVIVTTKKGARGAAKFSYNTTVGMQEISKRVDVLNSEEWLGLVKEAYSNDKKQLPEFYSKESSAYANTNWQDEIYRTSFYQNHQIAISGGNEKIKYYLAGNVLDNDGILITTYQKNYSLNGNFEMELNPKLKAGLTFNVSHIKERVNKSVSGFGHTGGGYGISGGIVQQALFMPPIVPVYTGNGDYGQITQGEFAPFFPSGYANPVGNLKETHDVYSRNNIIGRTFINYEPISGLSFNVSLSATLNAYSREWFVSPYLSGGSSPYANFSNPVYSKMSAGQENGTGSSVTGEAYVDYKLTFLNDHRLELMAGASRQYNGLTATAANSSANDRGSANALNPIPAFDNYYRPNVWGAALVLGTGYFDENTFESVFARLNYSYKNKYIFMASMRRDGSSKFAPDGRWGIFPAISGAWRLTEELFMKEFSWLNEFKLRASYGISGNDQFQNYAWQGTVAYNNLYTYAPVSDGGSGTGRVVEPSTIENKKLKWETNEQIDFGIDLGILNSRINLQADYFIRNTKDMLLYRSLPLENGISSNIFDNIGNMTNKGVELTLNTVNIKSKDFSWSSDITFTKVSNEVKKVFTSTGDIKLEAGTSGSGFESGIRITEGRPMFEIYAYKVLGNFETQEQLTTYPRPNNAVIGDPMIEDYKKDKQINTDDLQPMGHALPDFTYGVSNTFRFKNIDLSVLIEGSHGASKIVTALRQAALMRSSENTIREFYDDRYVQGETGHHFAYASTGVTGARHWNMSYFIFDASYVRIKNIVLGYDLKESLTSKLKVESLRLTLGVQNLFTLTNYPLYNPQANNYEGAPGSAQFGVDMGQYPLPRIYTFGLNLTF